MKLIVGLGNPGSEYESTRHNIGFMVLEKLARELVSGDPQWKEEARHKALTLKIGDVVLVKPQTFMNASGVAVKSVLAFYNMSPGDVWAIHDDMDLPIGKLRIRTGGASAGHHGIDSLIRELKTDQFVRFRLGVGRGKEARGKTANKNFHRRFVIDFVLSAFSQHEAGNLRHLVKHAVEAVRTALFKGLDKAMNRFH